MTQPALPLNAWLRLDAVMRVHPRARDAASVLEIGCGLGAMGARLARHDYVGVEPDEVSRTVARSRLPRVVASLDEVEDGREFDLVCAFEVLEHLSDDHAQLRGWARRVAPGGALLLSVPADPARWGAWDVLAGHRRRYAPDALAAMLADAGLADIEVLAYGGPLGYTLEAARNLIARRRLRGRGASAERRTAGSARLIQPPDLLAPVTAAVSAPFRFLQRASTERGTGLVGVGHRRA